MTIEKMWHLKRCDDWEFMTIEKIWILKRCDDWEYMTIEMMGHCYDNDMAIDMTYGMTIYIFSLQWWPISNETIGMPLIGKVCQFVC